jgi:hypothetical protein
MVVEINDSSWPATTDGAGDRHIFGNKDDIVKRNSPVGPGAAKVETGTTAPPPHDERDHASPLPLVEQGSGIRCGGTKNGSIPRLVKRNLPFHQSLNRVQVTHNQGFKIFLLLKHDWFHVILRVSTYQSLLVLLSIWTGVIIVFASLYVWIDRADPTINCGLGLAGSPITFGAAFAFSLQTTTSGTFLLFQFFLLCAPFDGGTTNLVPGYC